MCVHQGITQMKYHCHASNAINTVLRVTALHSMIASFVIILSTFISQSFLSLLVGYQSAGMGSYPLRLNSVMMEIL